MKQPPVAIGLVLCEQVIVDAKSRNLTPVNCFNSRQIETIPGQATFYAVAWLTDGMGKMHAQVVVERLDTAEEVFRLERDLQFASPLNDMRCVVRVKCPFPVAGYYELSLFIDRELIAHCKFSVKSERG